MDEYLSKQIHEVADYAVNRGGYADDSDESDRRSEQRDALETALRETVARFTRKEVPAS